MKKLFNNILVPVDFSRQTPVVMKEAIELANQFECNIHILYVQPSKAVFPFLDSSAVPANDHQLTIAEQKMWELRRVFRFDLHPPLSMHTAVHTGNIESAIMFYCIKNQIDLVVFNRTSKGFRAWFHDVNINRLAKKIRCPVLSLQSEVNLEKLGNIVLPVGEFLPVRKLMFATYLAKKHKSRLHLIATREEESDVSLLKAYRLIRDDIELPVECKTFNEGNIADVTLQYARGVQADLIVVNPGKESLLSGFFNRVFSRFLASRSNIPVMTVASVR